MKPIQMNSRLRTGLLLLFFSFTAGFPNVLVAGDDEPKSEEGKSQGTEAKSHDEKSPEKSGLEGKSGKVPSRKKPLTSDEANASSASRASGGGGGNGHNVLAQASGCLVDRSALEDLKRIREELDERKKILPPKNPI